ncbi:ABC transporter substrate-binding protein [Marinomonas sp.]|uniref:ABC transporter substrate-binding protein n=1 Tax=Marinomonas sp. TaxID=1904862 RepID=UPI003BAC77CD
MKVKTIVKLVSLSAMISSVPAVMAEDSKIEMMTSWTSGGEAAALNVYRSEFEKSGGEWVDSSIAGFGAADAAFLNRVIAGKPPSGKSTPIGAAADEYVAQGILADLGSVAHKEDWKSVLPASIYDLITYDGETYLAPTGAHGESWMFYSKSAFAKAGIDGDFASWEDLFAALDKLKAANIIPIAWGGQGWQEGIVFNMILLSQVGQENYLAIYRDKKQNAKLEKGVKDALSIYRKLSYYDDEGSPGRNWNDATAMVIGGKAGIQFMGDYAKGEFDQAGSKLGVDYGCSLVPESKSMVYIADSIAFPKMESGSLTAGQAKIASIIMNPESQIEFSLKKGSIPVRLDVDTSRLDECSKQGLSLMNENKIVPDYALLITPEQKGNVADFTDNFWVNNSISVKDGVKTFFSVLKY